MRLRTENIHEYRLKCNTVAQITLDDDFNVPDTKDDIELIVKEWGNVQTDSVKVNKDKAAVDGELKFSLLYIGASSDSERMQPVKMTGKMSFSENVNLSGDCTGDYVTCQASIEDLSIKAINSRKISVKAIVTLKLICESLQDIQMITGVDETENTDIQQLKEELEFVQLAVNQRDNFRIRENVSLPAGKPEIQEIIWDDVDVRNLNTRLADDGLKLAGDLDIFVMYIGNGETGNVQWYETTASFEGSLDISGCNADMIPYVNFQIIGKTVEERPDLDGENRDIAVEVVLDMDVKAYEERKKDVIADIYSPSYDMEIENADTQLRTTRQRSCVSAFSPSYDMEIENADTQLRCLVVRNNVSSRVSGNLQLENYADLMQICNCTATVQLDDVTYKEGELVAEGVVSANVFYITSSDSQPLGSVHTIIPFAGTVKIDGVSPDSLEYNIKPSVQQLSATINSAGVIEVKSSVSLDVIVFRNFEYSGIKSAYMSEEKCDLSKMPSMTGYIADGTKTLWDVSKMYHTTADSIKASNPKCADGLSESVIIPRGTKLLLVKA